jgi:ABC-2 type transport system permease protein
MRLLIQFIIKEFLQFKRDRKMISVVLVAPILQLILLGYAATFDLREIHTVIFDKDKSRTSRDLVNTLQNSGYFSIDNYVSGYDDFTRLITDGDALVGIVIPTDFEKNINSDKTAQLQAIFDGSDGNKASIAAGYVIGAVSGFSQNINTQKFLMRGLINPLSGSIQPEVRIWFNPDLTTRNYMLPGIAGLIITLVTTLLTSLAIVKEREIGTLEQLIVSPLKPYQIIIGKFIPFTILGFISASLVLTVMRFWFGIPIRGNVILLYFSALLYMLSTLGLSLFVSTISRTQVQAMMTAGFGIMMPMIFFSGFAFPIENMPAIIQYITYLVPLRYFIVILRGIILKGIGIADLWPQTLALLIFGILIVFLSSLRFRKKLG